MKKKIKVGDIVEVICETPFDSDEPMGKVRHARKLGERCQVMRLSDTPNSAGQVVFTQDERELNSSLYEFGQYINTVDLKVIGKSWEEVYEQTKTNN